jgi:hypothetical protein
MQNFHHNIGFCEKRQFFCRKLAKIAEKCDHNIDPWFDLNLGKLLDRLNFSICNKLLVAEAEPSAPTLKNWQSRFLENSNQSRK